MRLTILVMLFVSALFGQVASSEGAHSGDGLVVELRTGADLVQLTDDLIVTVVFRSPLKITTIWNALGWGVATGLRLQVLDSSGREVRSNYAPMYHVVPPDMTGNNALISIGGSSFAGFDSRLPVRLVFHEPGRYTLRCIYTPTLPRNYFEGRTIWGKEDGTIMSAAVPITVAGR